MLFGAAAVAIATLAPPDVVLCALATSASALVEATPFLFAGIVVGRLLRHPEFAIAYVGCGCTSGASARSLPATAAAWFVFGPLVAVGRHLAAILFMRLRRRDELQTSTHQRGPRLLAELNAVVPAALMAGTTAQFFQYFDRLTMSPMENVLAGAALGFAAAPCGIGAVALAGALRVHAPLAASAFLCIAGICDVRAFGVRQCHRRADHDACAYMLLAIALGIIALQRGDALVHPLLAGPLAVCAVAASGCAIYYRRRRCGAARIAPALMLAGALIGAPAPVYHATETTLSDLFAGERVTFAGALTCDGADCALIRYAITCCRADAVPVVLRLYSRPAYRPGSWLRADGRIDAIGDDLRLVPERLERTAAPTDPFIYR